MKKKILQGYTFTRNVDGLSIPTNIQSLIIRNFCHANDFIFKLHIDEFCHKNSYVQLFQILNNKKKINAIGICTINFLPKEKSLLKQIFTKAKLKKIEIIFILENIIFKNQSINKFINEIDNIRKINYLTKK